MLFLCGGSSKYLQNVSLHFPGPLQKHVEQCSLHFGYAHPFKRWLLFISIYSIYRLYMSCIVLVFLLISLNKSSWPTMPCQHRGWKACCRSVASAAPRKCWRRRFVGTCGWLKPSKKRWYHGNFMGISWELHQQFKIWPTTNWDLYDLSVIKNDRTSRNVTGSRLFVQGNYPRNGQTFQVGELSWLIHIQTILGELWYWILIQYIYHIQTWGQWIW